jgi:monoamine oxidase
VGSADLTADVAVVGAGLSGLVAARRLTERGLRVVVLEARDRVGGRTLNADIAPGKTVEVGGQFVGPDHDALLRVAAEVGVTTFPTHNDGTHLLELRGRMRSWDGKTPWAGPIGSVSYLRAQRALNRMARQVRAEAPWEASRAREWDGETLASWMRRRMASRTARSLLATAVRAIWAVEPEDISVLQALVFISATGEGLEYQVRTQDGNQQDRFVGGSQRISQLLASQLPDPPMLGHPVRRIEQDGEHVVVHADGVVVRAARAIVAVPPMLAARIDYAPAMPAGREQLLARSPQASALKYLAVYDTPFWRAAGLSGQVGSDRGPVGAAFDNSPPDGTPGILLGFVLGNHARQLLDVPADERRRRVLECFARWFGDEAREPREFLAGSWTEEEWTRGCYSGYLVPGAWTSFGHWLLKPHGLIHWAGSETATRHIGSMDGAVRAGERAADEVVAALGPARIAEPVEAAR